MHTQITNTPCMVVRQVIHDYQRHSCGGIHLGLSLSNTMIVLPLVIL